MTSAFALVVPTHGCKHAGLQTPYFVAVYINGIASTAAPLHMPAVVDDFGNLVIVGGPL